VTTLSYLLLILLVLSLAANTWLAAIARRKPKTIPGPERVIRLPGPERVVRVEVPGPERIVEVSGPERMVKVEVPGPERVVRVEVPGPERIVEVSGPEKVIYRDVPGPEVYVPNPQPVSPPAIAAFGDEPQLAVHPHALPLGLDSTPDTVMDGADLGPLLIRAVSIRGDRNREDARFRGDTFLLHVFEGGFPRPVLLSVAAAGLSRGSWANAGAVRFCRSLATALRERAGGINTTWESGSELVVLHELLRSATQDAVRPLRELAKVKNTSLTTEFTAVLTPLGDGARRQHLVFGVGNGTVWRVRGGNWSQHLPQPHDDPSPVTLPDAPEAVTWVTVETEPKDLLLLCTGPMGRLTQRIPVRDFFNQAWAPGPPHLNEFLWHMTFRAPAAADDRTAIGLWDFRVSDAVPVSAD
jgi:hypothetical protein